MTSKFKVNKIGNGHPHKGSYMVCARLGVSMPIDMPVEQVLDAKAADDLAERLNAVYEAWRLKHRPLAA